MSCSVKLTRAAVLPSAAACSPRCRCAACIRGSQKLTFASASAGSDTRSRLNRKLMAASSDHRGGRQKPQREQGARGADKEAAEVSERERSEADSPSSSSPSAACMMSAAAGLTRTARQRGGSERYSSSSTVVVVVVVVVQHSSSSSARHLHSPLQPLPLSSHTATLHCRPPFNPRSQRSCCCASKLFIRSLHLPLCRRWCCCCF